MSDLQETNVCVYVCVHACVCVCLLMMPLFLHEDLIRVRSRTMSVSHSIIRILVDSQEDFHST